MRRKILVCLASLTLAALSACGTSDAPTLSLPDAARLWTSLDATEGMRLVTMDTFTPEHAFVATVRCPAGGTATAASDPTWTLDQEGRSGHANGSVNYVYRDCNGASTVRLTGQMWRTFQVRRQGPVHTDARDYVGFEYTNDHFYGTLQARGPFAGACVVDVQRQMRDGSTTFAGFFCDFDVHDVINHLKL